jgi:hypothetical protein
MPLKFILRLYMEDRSPHLQLMGPQALSVKSKWTMSKDHNIVQVRVPTMTIQYLFLGLDGNLLD